MFYKITYSGGEERKKKSVALGAIKAEKSHQKKRKWGNKEDHFLINVTGCQCVYMHGRVEQQSQIDEIICTPGLIIGELEWNIFTE